MQTLAEINESDLYSYIVKTVEAEKGIKIASPTAYAEKCVFNNLSHWQSRYMESEKTDNCQKDFVLQDWHIEQRIAVAMGRGDYKYAIATFKKYPELQEKLLLLHPNWSKKLTGVKSKNFAQANEKFLTTKLAMLKAKIKLRLGEEQKIKTQREIDSLEGLLTLRSQFDEMF
jgi:hypothetical protein